MVKLSPRALKVLLKSKNLLGVSYKVTNKEDSNFFTYPMKPILKGYSFGKVDGVDDFFETTVTVNPRTQAQDDRITSIIPVLEEYGFIRLKGAETVNPLKVLGSLSNGEELQYEELLARKELLVSFSFEDATVTPMTIVKEKVSLVSLKETDSDTGDCQELLLLFGEQDNLHGLSTYINSEFTRADLRKFTELLVKGVLSVDLMFIRLTLEDVNATVIHTPSVLGGSPTVEVEEDGTFIISMLHGDGVLNVKDKNSSVILVETNGSYILRFYSKKTGNSKLELYLK